jgi:D-lactate dehydrogenase (cytochrome)
MVDLTDPPQLERAKRVNAPLVDHALSVEGTCSGEHGIGLGKLPSLVREHRDLLPYMRQIKAAFDPHGL